MSGFFRDWEKELPKADVLLRFGGELVDEHIDDLRPARGEQPGSFERVEQYRVQQRGGFEE